MSKEVKNKYSVAVAYENWNGIGLYHQVVEAKSFKHARSIGEGQVSKQAEVLTSSVKLLVRRN